MKISIGLEPVRISALKGTKNKNINRVRNTDGPFLILDSFDSILGSIVFKSTTTQ